MRLTRGGAEDGVAEREPCGSASASTRIATIRTRSPIPVDSGRALAALAASNTLGVLVLFVIPLLVGATADGFHAREGTAGIVSAWELGAMAALSMLIAARFRRLDVRCWSWIGALAYTAGSLLSLACVSAGAWEPFLAARGVVGAGEGILYAVSSGLAAQTRQPDRTFSWFAGSHVVTSVLCFWALPAAVGWLGPAGAFGGMAAVGMLALPLLRWTPAPAQLHPASDDTARAAHGEPEPVATLDLANLGAAPRSTPFGVTLLLLLSVGSLNLGLNTVFPFTERIGIAIGFSLDEIGQILSLGAILSITGPIAAGVLGPRGGRTLPLAFGSASQIAGVLVLVYATSHALWAGSYVVSSMALMYFMPLLYGLVAFYDRSGRINAAAASVTAWTSAAGPLLAGLVLNAGGSYQLIGWLTALAYAAIFAFAYGPACAAERGPRSR